MKNCVRDTEYGHNNTGAHLLRTNLYYIDASRVRWYTILLLFYENFYILLPKQCGSVIFGQAGFPLCLGIVVAITNFEQDEAPDREKLNL